MEVYYYKNKNGFISWFLKDEQIDHDTSFKTFYSAKKSIISELRSPFSYNYFLNADEFTFKRAR